MMILLPVQAIFKNASMFFSTATRPTYAAIGRGSARKSFGWGLNISVSTPRRQVAKFSKPCAARSRRTEAVLTMQRAAAPWNQRSAR